MTHTTTKDERLPLMCVCGAYVVLGGAVPYVVCVYLRAQMTISALRPVHLSRRPGLTRRRRLVWDTALTGPAGMQPELEWAYRSSRGRLSDPDLCLAALHAALSSGSLTARK